MGLWWARDHWLVTCLTTYGSKVTHLSGFRGTSWLSLSKFPAFSVFLSQTFLHSLASYLPQGTWPSGGLSWKVREVHTLSICYAGQSRQKGLHSLHCEHIHHNSINIYQASAVCHTHTVVSSGITVSNKTESPCPRPACCLHSAGSRWLTTWLLSTGTAEFKLTCA